jgi:uncharacterized protein YodC (DUF2158 family)
MKMENELKVNDVVKCNIENSPSMLITEISKNKAHCVWFDKNQVYREQVFLLDNLKVIKKGSIKATVTRSK